MCYVAQKHTAIVNSLDPVRINLCKNSSSCTTKIIPNFCVFFKSSFTNQRDEVDNNRFSSSYSLSNWYSRFLCLAKMPLSKHGHSTFIMIIPQSFSSAISIFFCAPPIFLIAFFGRNSTVVIHFFQISFLLRKEAYWKV